MSAMSVEQEARELLAAELPDQLVIDANGRAIVDAAIRAITAALLRSSASRDEVLEKAAKRCRDLGQTGERAGEHGYSLGCDDCAEEVRNLKSAQGSG